MFSDFAYGVNVTLSLHTNSNKYVPYLYTLIPLDIRVSKKGKLRISKYPQFLNYHLKKQNESFIIRVEGNGDIRMSPLP